MSEKFTTGSITFGPTGDAFARAVDAAQEIPEPLPVEKYVYTFGDWRVVVEGGAQALFFRGEPVPFDHLSTTIHNDTWLHPEGHPLREKQRARRDVTIEIRLNDCKPVREVVR